MTLAIEHRVGNGGVNDPQRMGIGYGMPKIVGAFELGLDASRTGN
jgi:hypothetical protein